MNKNLNISTHFRNHKNIIINELRQAKSKIQIAVAWFTNHAFYEVICAKVQEGISVELIIVNDEINNRKGGLSWQNYIDIGGKLYFGNTQNPMHHKFCIIDESVLINGSFNWTYYAEKYNHENIVVFKDNEVIIQAFMNEFTAIRNSLQPQETVIPYPDRKSDFKNIFDTKEYLSKDLELQAYHEKEKGNLLIAQNLLSRSINLTPSRSELRESINDISKQVETEREYQITRIQHRWISRNINSPIFRN